MPATELGHIISAVFRYSAPISQLLIRKFWVFYYQKVHFSCLFCGILIFDIDELGHIISAIFRYSAPISQLLIRKVCFVVPKGQWSVTVLSKHIWCAMSDYKQSPDLLLQREHRFFI